MNIKQLNIELDTLSKAKNHLMKSKKSIIKHTQGDVCFSGYLRKYDKVLLDIEQIEADLQLWIADIKGDL
jgi:hypothetical protein